jgi:hypothetical protein
MLGKTGHRRPALRARPGQTGMATSALSRFSGSGA